MKNVPDKLLWHELDEVGCLLAGSRSRIAADCAILQRMAQKQLHTNEVIECGTLAYRASLRALEQVEQLLNGPNPPVALSGFRNASLPFCGPRP